MFNPTGTANYLRPLCTSANKCLCSAAIKHSQSKVWAALILELDLLGPLGFEKGNQQILVAFFRVWGGGSDSYLETARAIRK